MYVQVLSFYNICLLTYFHIKIFVGVHKAENVLHAFYRHSMFLGQHQNAYGFLINDSRVSAAIFHEWQTGLGTLQKTYKSIMYKWILVREPQIILEKYTHMLFLT